MFARRETDESLGQTSDHSKARLWNRVFGADAQVLLQDEIRPEEGRGLVCIFVEQGEVGGCSKSYLWSLTADFDLAVCQGGWTVKGDEGSCLDFTSSIQSCFKRAFFVKRWKRDWGNWSIMCC